MVHTTQRHKYSSRTRQRAEAPNRQHKAPNRQPKARTLFFIRSSPPPLAENRRNSFGLEAQEGSPLYFQRLEILTWKLQILTYGHV